VVEAGLEVAAVERLVIAHEPTSGDPGDHSALPLDALIGLGVCGSRGAQPALKRYVANGVDLPHVH
jgi:hypothetical protein